jgi:uncharacterized membrane protein
MMPMPWMIPLAMLLMAVMFDVSSRLSRPDIVFAVTVAPGFRYSAEGRAIFAGYRRIIWSASAGAALVTALLIQRWPFVVIPAALAQTIACMFAIVIARRRTLPYAQAARVREVELAPDRRLPGGVGVRLLPFLIVLGSALYLALHWQAIPERFPIHWDASRQPDGWATRSFLGVFGGGLLSLIVLAGTSLLSLAIARKARAGSSADRQMRDLTLWIIFTIQLLVAMIASLVMLLPVLPGVTQYLIVIPIAVILFVVGSIIAAVLMTRRLSAGGGDFTPDACWKGGLFYYNPDDPAIFVEKRFGIGYTLNFGNRWAWLAMAVMLLPGLTVLIMAITKSR